jgi:hypothetical protein
VISSYRPNKVHDKRFTVPVFGQSVSISAGFVLIAVTALVLCSGDVTTIDRKYCWGQSTQKFKTGRDPEKNSGRNP